MESKASKESKEAKESNSNESKEAKESRESKESKGIKGTQKNQRNPKQIHLALKCKASPEYEPAEKPTTSTRRVPPGIGSLTSSG